MVMSFDEAVAAVTGPGQVFSVVEQDVLGRPTKVYENAIPSLRGLFDLARARRRRDLPRLRGRAAHLRRRHGPGRRHGHPAGRPLRRHPGRPGRHRHAQLPRVDRVVRRHHLHRGRRGVAERVVDRGRDGVRPARLGHDRVPRRPRAGRAGRAGSSSSASAPWSSAAGACSRPAPSASTTSSSPVPRCPRWTSTPTTTPPSSTPRAPPVTRRARCRPTVPCFTALMAFACRAVVDGLQHRPRGTPHPCPTSLHPHRAALPRHRLRARDAQLLSLGGFKLVMMHKWDPDGPSS